ncbi:MAG: M24 family metallopeptidase [Gemmatimonadales bacterium]
MVKTSSLVQKLVAAPLLAACVMGVGSSRSVAQDIPRLPSLREQAEIQQGWLERRLETVLPRLMREHHIDMWIVPMSEYNEDPVFPALVSPTRFAARRRTIFVFYDRGDSAGVERLALGGGSESGVYQSLKDPYDPTHVLYLDPQWEVLRRVVEERQPEAIGINASTFYDKFGDGLASGERELLERALGPKWSARFVPAGLLPVEYLATRIPEMMPYYRKMMQIVHALIATAFSNEVITPGETTTTDVEWWLRQRVHDMAMGSWFQPSVEVQRRGASEAAIFGMSGVIERGDVLHVDFGIYATGLATDTQHMGYVLREGESDVPDGLKQALRTANRLQDILLSQMKPGRTGNQVQTAALAQMNKEGITGRIYTHPIGDYGHGPGPTIGLVDRQEGEPKGNIHIIPNTWYSIELYAASKVPEWDGQVVGMPLEEDAAVTAEGKMEWILKRQTEFHIVR